MSGDAALFEAAVRIGARLGATALWDGDVCTWRIAVDERRSRRAGSPREEIAPGTLYRGTAGIGLFLLELFRVHDDVGVRRAARGAVLHATRAAERLPLPGFGFHSGRVGIAYAAARAGIILEEPELAVAAARILSPLAGREHEDGSIDVIGGAGGAIPALLRLAALLDEPDCLELARRLGDRLIAVARREVAGWSWSAVPRSLSDVRNLTGLAHGAAGVAHALLELHRATGRGVYRYAAEQGFLYERTRFDAAAGNWLDLRHTELADCLFDGGVHALRERLGRGEEIPPYRRRCMTAWCHGAPGIGLTRLRAYELLRDPVYREEAEVAVGTTVRSLATATNYCLCHGLAGNCETLLAAARLLGQPELRHRAEECLLEGVERFERARKPWPCGVRGAPSDPSLMLGEAGIGYFCLRLHDPSTPPVLLLESPHQRAAEDDSADVRRLEREHAELYFGRTSRIFERLGAALEGAAAPPGAEPLPPGVVGRVRAAIRGRIAGETDPQRRTLLEDAFRLDHEVYRATLAITDYTEALFEQLRRAAREPDWDRARVVLSDRARLVEQAWDWDAWLADPERTAGPAPGPVTHLVFPDGDAARTWRLGPFTQAVLLEAAAPATAGEIAVRLAQRLDTGDAESRAALEAAVLRQLQQAYRAGVIRIVEPADAEAAALPGAARPAARDA